MKNFNGRLFCVAVAVLSSLCLPGISSTLAWNTFLGASGINYGYSLVADASGNVYISGYSNATWGTPVRAFTGGSDAFVAKLNASGVLQWNTFVGETSGSSQTPHNGLVVDASGNVYVSFDAYVVKLNGSGVLQWNTFLGSSTNDDNYALAVDASGNIYVTGFSWGTWGTPILPFSGNFDAFVAKINASGVLQWNSFLGSSSPDYGYGIAVDTNRNVFVTGYSSATWGTPIISFGTAGEAFVAKLNENGNLLWNTFLGGTAGDDHGYGITTDTGGNAYVTGDSWGTWGTPVRPFSGNNLDAFAAKLNGSGALQWNAFLGSTGTDTGHGVSVDASGYVYVIGNSNYSWGSPFLPFSGGSDAFIAKLDNSGAPLQWNAFLGSTNSDYGKAIAVYTGGNVYVSGYSGATWGSPILPFAGAIDAFVAKISDNDSSASLALTSPVGGEIWIGGSTHNITWTTTGTVANVKLEYSTNTGTNWTTIVDSTANSGTYSWTVPVVVSINCLIRVSDALNAVVNDMSDVVFSIIATPTLTVTSPNGGESWLGGLAHNITWTTTGTVANVKLEYSTNNGTNWTTIIASTANANSYVWTVPVTASAQYLVRVSDAAASSINDTSDAVFTVVVDGTEPNNDSASATSLPTGTTENLIYTEGDVDWYKFFVPAAAAGQDLKVNVQVTSPYPDPLPADWGSDVDFDLLDGSLRVLGTTLSSSDNETIYLHAVASGWYYVYIGYITTDYADSSDYARYSITLETGTGFGLGYITGRVVNGSGQGAANEFLLLDPVPDNWTISRAYMTTGTDGNFTIAFTPGTYTLLFSNGGRTISQSFTYSTPNVVGEYYNNKKKLADADPITISGGQTLNLGDVPLDTGAIVSGNVTDASNAPLANVAVWDYDLQGNASRYHYAKTDAAGNYSLSGVLIGGAKLRFVKTGYASEYYNNKPSYGVADILSTLAGGAIADINAQLTSGGIVSGNVTDKLGAGIGGVEAKMYSVLDNAWSKASVVTASGSGNYRFFNVMPGSYKIKFVPNRTAYGSEWYNDMNSYATATIITVTEGNETAEINAQLGTPEINLKQEATDIVSGGTYAFGPHLVGTNSDTIFTVENTGTDTLILTGLPLTITGPNADQFAITVQPVSPVSAAGNTSFTVRFLPTSAGDKTAIVSVASNDGNENPYVLNLTGTGTVIVGTLTLTSPNGGENWLLRSTHPVTWTSTGTIGNVKIEYSTNNGTSWTTIVASTPNDGEIYWTSGSPTDAALNTLSTTCLVRVSDAAGAAVPDISNAVFTISASGIITGTVTDLSGAPIEGASAQAFDLNNVRVATRYTNASGQYWIVGLRAGSYKVVFFNDYTQNYLYEWYNDQRNFNAAASVAVTLNNTTANINAQLGVGGIISGRVTNESGAGLEGVSITAFTENGYFGLWSAESDSNGDYQVKGLPAGNCRLMYYGLSGYPLKFYGNVYTFDPATNVPVTLGAETSGINIVLENGGQISGTVTDGSGSPVSGIRVLFYDPTNHSNLRLQETVVTAADGTYSGLVRTGQTKVYFDTSAKPASGLRSQFYSNQSSLDSAGAVSVVKNQATPNINAVLAAGGGTLTVQVTNGLGQGVVAAAYLYDTLYATRVRPSSSTDANGYLEIKGLIPGNYKVNICDANGEYGRYVKEWYNNALTFENAAPVNVTEGGTTALTVVLGETAPVAPEINLKQGATNIATGGTYGFGTKIVGTDTDTVFTIQNTGSAGLTLSGLPLMVGGTNANQFSITVQPTSPIAAAGSKTFSVRFHPTSAGDKTAQLSIANNDGNENPYVLNLTGTGTVVGGIPAIGLSNTALNFGAERNGTPTAPQDCVVSNTGTGVLNWTASSSTAWLGVTPGSGTGAGLIFISILNTNLGPGTYTGTITVADPNATNSPRTITVTLIIKQTGTDSPPFGKFETPTDGATVASSVPVTGWVLDDVGMQSIKIFRGTGLTDRIFIGDAILVEGARPDVRVAYPTYPENSIAGWGYMLLTNFLPNGGNGTFTLLAYAKDTGGHEVLLGTKTITCNNTAAVKPFGAIDTPSQGGTASGSNYVNFGWALTPQPNSIPTDGSTIWVYVDGVPLGHPTYNQYRKDIATLFPGYANSNGAVGYYYLNTALYTDAVHTIVWSVADSGGNMDGIGSRYFSIQNAGGGSRAEGTENGESAVLNSNSRFNVSVRSLSEIATIPEDGRTPVYVKRGYRDDQQAEIVFPEADGSIRITIPEVSRVAVYLNEENTGEKVEETAERGRRILNKSVSTAARYEAYQLVGSELFPLPIGASFDSRDGVFYWHPGPGFLGEFQFVVVDRATLTRKTVKITIVGDRSGDLSPM